ncbi:MAG: tRNA (adenosine(37)-N6)-threonylcarbamoyltransferase complex dimerization subunit type 1 TsaB [Nitrospiraceae bacterium]|nr:tRNA (adenosine(37)-N6)-threonylcarbamoyltransferase complex dimerization subunit type 1 TsaB [Nitrospiraceae bacterium]
MLILAADTTTPVNTVALVDGPRVLAETYVECGRAHAERLLATVDWVLSEARVALDDLDALAISNGPGSFTGLRVGAATWKGLAFARNLPLVAVPTLDAMTRLGYFRDAIVIPLLDAKMREVFAASFEFDNAQRRKLTEDMAGPVETVLGAAGPTPILLGDGSALYRERILEAVPGAVIVEGPFAMPRASAVAAEASALLDAGAETDPAAVAPVYLRKSQAEEARSKSGAQSA